MTLQFLLDTDTCVYWLRGREAVCQHVLNVGPAAIAISIITLAELRHGAACSAQVEANHQAIDAVTGAITVIGIDASMAQRFGDIKADLRPQGALLEDSDLLIAATALSLGVTLVTSNNEHLRLIPGLKLEKWVEQSSFHSTKLVSRYAQLLRLYSDDPRRLESSADVPLSIGDVASA